MQRRIFFHVLALAAMQSLGQAALATDAAPTPAALAESDVHVTHVGETVTVDCSFYAPVAPAQAWAVLTDFAHMREFLPNLESSRVQEHSPTTLKLTQTGVAKYGVFSSHFESIREITLVPQREIQALGVGGTVPHAESRMQLLAEGSGTRMVYHAKVQPGGLFPPFIGPDLVRHQTAQQFSAMVQEMQRRATAAP
jgi:carbon monoxide dehydrogenase subunit G